MTMTRTLWIAMALIMCACVSAPADPILLAPSGKTLGFGQVRAEAALSSDSHNGKYFWLGTGVMQVEANVIRLDAVKGRTENRVNVQWNFLPETFATPAVAFGATDVTSQSTNGAGAYVVTTKRLKTAGFVPMLKELSGTAGIGVAGIRGPFFGFEAKFPLGIFAEAEYDSRNFNGAVGWQPVKLLRLKAYSIQHEFYVGAEIPPISF